MEPGWLSYAPADDATAPGGKPTVQLLELSAGLFATVGPDELIKWSNASWQRTLGWTNEELCDRPFTELVHPDDVARTDQEVRRTFTGENRIGFENRYLSAAGSYRVLSWRFALADGVALVAGTDVTRQSLAEHAVLQLEERVAQRTAELEMISEEFEAFNYAVSHDLRAPLRAIDGFSAVVARQYAERLDDSGQELLARVRRGVAKLDELIDAMLMLSRRSRQGLRLQNVDLSELAREVVSGLRERDPHRSVETAVAAGLNAVGDPKLLRVVFEELLRNAWKFTANRKDARIEFSSQAENGREVYVVRDNGVGFDMTYADRLFVPFQRLHREDEFPGVGAGLATVRRIVRRHGGNVLGEGRTGAGAVFRFDLGRASQRPSS
jgi:PAS domain S-box-containing protein